jgi:hypothetical protein
MKLGISDTKLNMLVSTSDHFSIGTFRVKGLSDLIISEDLGIFYTTSVPQPHITHHLYNYILCMLDA